MIVFIDMDGVLADFDGAIIKQFESKKIWDIKPLNLPQKQRKIDLQPPEFRKNS